MRPYPVLLFLLAVVYTACRPGQPQVEQAQAEEEVDLNEFYNFYQSFHIDSAYQMDHIIFPLQGLPSNADSITIARNNFHWEREDWILHQPVDFETSEFRREILPLSEEIVLEKIVHRSGQTGMLRRFAKIGDDWYLIYFADLNRIRQ